MTKLSHKNSSHSHLRHLQYYYLVQHKIILRQKAVQIIRRNQYGILRCENLTKTYGEGNAQVKALDEVSFSVEKGEFVSIVGPSGSGKSTLLHILGGVDKPTSGKVYIDGTDVHALKENKLAIFRRRQIGLIYQFYNLMPVLNVDENIVLADEPTGNLDRKNGQEIIRLLKESNKNQKQTLILITHDESIALQADRMIYIEDGKLVRDAG